MSRKKIDDNEKNVKLGITIHPKLVEILKKIAKEKNLTNSKLIQDIMMEHFKNKNINND